MRIKKDVVIQKMGQVFVAYDNDTGTLHELNETGFTILEAIERGLTRQKTIERLTRNFDVNKKRAEKDYEAFLKILAKKDLMTSK